MIKVIQRLGKHCSCYLQGEYVMVGPTNQKNNEGLSLA
jgi:hypothetical protein